jgi:polysaccharide export outer membrane protein
MNTRISVFWLSLTFGLQAIAQQPQVPGTGQTPQLPAGPAGANPSQAPPELSGDIRPNYTLGPNDQILIRAPGADEINDKPFRIDAEGYLNLPLVGRIRASGLSIAQLEMELVKRLREYIVQPQVIITPVQFRGDPIFFEGMFQRPGIYTLSGRRTLVEMLALVGGLQPNASRRIKIRRHAEYGPIPLPSAVEDSENKVSMVEISFASLRQNVNPAEDIILKPYDVVIVDRAELIYVGGEVTRVGGIELGERDFMSVTQALTMSGGFTRDANKSKVRVLRPVLNTSRRHEIDIDLTGIYEGKVNDFPLLPNDVLYVPRAFGLSALTTSVPLAFSILNPFLYLALK